MTEQIVTHLGYVGIALILVLGGLGLPIPEEAPVILAAVLSKSGKMIAPLALATCLAGVLLGDFVVYFLGYFYGEKVLSLRLTRRLLTRPREAQIKGYFHRHGFKILILGRFAVGFRTAAYLTAGILQLPPLKLFLTDLLAASLSTFLMFGLGYVFAQQIESGIREAQQYFAVTIAVGVVVLLLYRFYRGQKRAGLPVGPPVLMDEEAPLPPDDLSAHGLATRKESDSTPVREPATCPGTPGGAAETPVEGSTHSHAPRDEPQGMPASRGLHPTHVPPYEQASHGRSGTRPVAAVTALSPPTPPSKAVE